MKQSVIRDEGEQVQLRVLKFHSGWVSKPERSQKRLCVEGSGKVAPGSVFCGHISGLS